jgi:hypothetical protein
MREATKMRLHCKVRSGGTVIDVAVRGSSSIDLRLDVEVPGAPKVEALDWPVYGMPELRDPPSFSAPDDLMERLRLHRKAHLRKREP